MRGERLELRYRALTHHNPGRCTVTLYRMQDAPWVCVAEDLDGHLGPPVADGGTGARRR